MAPPTSPTATFNTILCPGTVILLNADEVQVVATVAAADTDLKTYALAANTYSSILVEAEGTVRFHFNSVIQAVNLKIKFGAAQVGSTVNPAPGSAPGTDRSFPFVVKTSQAQTGALTIHVTQGAAGADALCDVAINSMRVYGVV